MSVAITPEIVNAYYAAHGVGGRCPTSFPVWVTLEVAEGGFATGAAVARLSAGDQTSTAFLASEDGIATLTSMLKSGCYRIEHPENAALLCFVWLLQQEDRAKDAETLFNTISPLMDVLRFYPYPTDSPVAISSVQASFINVGEAIAALGAAEKYEADMVRRSGAVETASRRYTVGRLQRAVADGYAEWQGDAIALLLTTVQNREEFLSCHDPNTSQVLFSLPIDASAAAALVSRASAIEAQYGVVPSHTNPTTTTAMVLAALRDPSSITSSETAMAALCKRLRDVAKSRGVKGSEQYERYITRTRVSAVPDQQMEATAKAVTAQLRHLPADGPLTEAVATTVTKAVATPTQKALPPKIARIIRRTTEGTLDDLVNSKVIVSAEMMALVVPRLLAAAIAESIEDPSARRLYTLLSISFAKRRSLLLVNYEQQVRLEELPWAAPLLPLIKESDARTDAEADDVDAADGSDSKVSATSPSAVVLREVVRCYFKHFPATITPNKLVSALKDAIRRGPPQQRPVYLTEELAADIFQGAFSISFNRAAIVAGEKMHGTVYERYYGLNAAYDGISGAIDEYQVAAQEFKKKSEAEAAALCDEWRVPHADFPHGLCKSIENYYASKYYSETGYPLASYGHDAPKSPRTVQAVAEMVEINTRKAKAMEVYVKSNYADYQEYQKALEVLSLEEQSVLSKYRKESKGRYLFGYENYYPNRYNNGFYSPRTTAAHAAIAAATQPIQQLHYSESYKMNELRKETLFLGKRATKLVDLWVAQAAKSGGPNIGPAQRYTVANGRVIEAAMVITTHNLAQLADVVSGDGTVDFASSALTAWEAVVATYANPPREHKALLHARRDTAYAWRQLLFFIGQLPDCGDEQRAVVEKMAAAVDSLSSSTKTNSLNTTAAVSAKKGKAAAEKIRLRSSAAVALKRQFIDPLRRVVDGQPPYSDAEVIDPLVLGYFGWTGFGRDASAASN